MMKHWKGPTDLEKKYNLEQELFEIELTHTASTAPKKFLDIFLLLPFFIF